MSRYTLHSHVWEDIREIWEFIAQKNPQAADRVEDELFEAFELLAERPGLGHLDQDLTSKPVRFWVVRRYLVVYEPDSEPLLIVMVIHGARRPETIAKTLADR